MRHPLPWLHTHSMQFTREELLCPWIQEASGIWQLYSRVELLLPYTMTMHRADSGCEINTTGGAFDLCSNHSIILSYTMIIFAAILV